MEGHGDVGTGVTTPRRWLIIASAGLLVAAFVQRWGEIIYLFRIDRVLDPLRFATRNLELWNPWWDLGSVQVQTVGYWLPIDVFFGLGAAVSVPTWILERVFIGGLLAIGLWGCVRLADRLHIGTPVTRLLAGLVYVLTSVIITRIGQQSVWGLGAVFAPWTIIPLVDGAAGGSPRRAAARSGVAIALMGGANAAVVFSVLPAPLLYLLTRRRGPRRAALLRWWSLAALAGMAIWLPGLVVLAGYGPNILGFTETVATTTGPTGLVDVLRGSADWLARVATPSVALPSGYTLATRALPIAATACIAAVGLAGLATRRLPERRFLVALLVIGVMAVGGAHGGLFGNPLTGVYRHLLDGTLGAFRNVYKFQALVTLPLALGVAHALAVTATLRATVARFPVRLAVVPLAALVIVGAAMPVWNGTLTRGPGFVAEPPAWDEARSWLEERDDEGRTLLLPGMGEGEFSWAYLRQMPVQWGADITWATRHQAPLGGAWTIDVLDTIEQVVATGGDPALPAFLRRAGFAHVLVAADYDPARFGAPDPTAIVTALTTSGLERVAAFGDDGFGDPIFGDGSLREIEIFSVPDPERVTTLPLDTATWLSGDIGSTFGLTDVVGDRAFVLVGDPVPDGVDPDLWTITDGNQRYLVNFGSTRANRSFVLGPLDPVPTDLPQLRERLIPAATTESTTLTIDGVRSVRASSVGPGVFSQYRPDRDPANILDGDPDWIWAPARQDIGTTVDWGTSDHWVELEFTGPRVVDPLAIELALGPFRNEVPVEVRTTTDAGTRTTILEPTEDPQPLEVAPGATSTLRVTLDASSFRDGGDLLGIRELDLPGPATLPRLAVPSQLADRFADPSTPAPAWVLTRNRLEGRESSGTWRRSITPPRDLTLGVIATGGLADRAAGLTLVNVTPTMSVEAGSTLFDLAAVAARNLVDGDPATAWVSGQTASNPTDTEDVTLDWGVPRDVDELRLVWDRDVFASPVEVAVAPVERPDEEQLAGVGADGVVRFPTVRTSGVVVRLVYPAWVEGEPDLAVGLDALEVPAAADRYPGPVDLGAPVEATCATGPVLEVAGVPVRFSAASSVGALLDGDVVDLTPCDTTTVALDTDVSGGDGNGSTDLDLTTGGSPFAVNRLVLGNPPLVAGSRAQGAGGGAPGTRAPSAGRAVEEVSWGEAERSVRVAPGGTDLLIVNEVFNRGWVAELDGVRLDALRIDGWRQAFVVPEGPGGVVNLTFAPNTAFQVGTWLGVAATLALFAVAFAPPLRRRDSRVPRLTTTPAIAEGSWPQWLVAGGVVVAGVWTCGVGAVALVPLWWLARRRIAAMPFVALAAFLTAGAWVVVTKSFPPPGPWGAEGWPAVVAAVVSLLTVVAVAAVGDAPAERHGAAP